MSNNQMRDFTGGTVPYRASPFRLYMADYAPTGTEHVSPEVHRARLTDVPVFRQETPVRITRHAHPGYEIDLVMHGSGRMLYGERESVELSPGHVLFVPMRIDHSLEVVDHLCIFGIELAPEVFLAGKGTATQHPVRLTHDPQVFHTFELLLDECAAEYAQTAAPYHANIAGTLGRLVALYVQRALEQQLSLNESPTAQRVLSVKRWIDRHLFAPVTLDELSEQAALSVSRFSALFRRLTGSSPKAYVTSHRLRHAAHLLAETGHSVTEIAQSVGYHDLANFHHAFRDYSGMSPLAYRKKYQKGE